MHGQTNSAALRFLNLFLNPPSLLYKSAAYLQRQWRSRRVFRIPSLFVVSIDNLSFGGTGKTALVLYLGRELTKLGLRFAVISRGYTSRGERKGMMVSSNADAREVGDEALLIKRNLPQTDVIIGRDRRFSLQLAAELGHQLIFLDDGFQSTHIQRDFRIMLLNPCQSYYYQRHFSFLSSQSDFQLYLGASPIQKRGPNRAAYSFRISGFWNALGEEVEVGEKGLFAFAALGDNARFFHDLRDKNLRGSQGFRDHHYFRDDDLRRLDRLCRRFGADYLVCSEKDFMKLQYWKFPDIPFLYTRNEIQLDVDIVSIILNHAKKKGFFSDLV